MESYDIIIAGAGAAGLMAAAQAGQRGHKVVILEQAAKAGEKIRISGGGRCNFTNLHCAPERYISQNPHFCKSALARYSQHDFIALVKAHGITWHEKTLGQLFCDGKSQAIIDMLLNECAKASVTIRLQTTIETVEKKEDGAFIIRTSKGPFTAPKLVIATGGPSIPKMGSSDFAYRIARQFGIKVIAPVAALVPLTFTDDILTLAKELSGATVDPVIVTSPRARFREALLFTHRGLSGPAILQISSYWEPGEKITVNLYPDTDFFAFLKTARTDNAKKKPSTILSTLLPQRLAQAIVQRTTGDALPLGGLSDTQLRTLADHVNHWHTRPNGTEGYRTAEVTRGGIDTDEISARTFESKKVPGLYFIGECVDVTGWLGGYNFQWAWSSGWCCGQEI